MLQFEENPVEEGGPTLEFPITEPQVTIRTSTRVQIGKMIPYRVALQF